MVKSKIKEKKTQVKAIKKTIRKDKLKKDKFGREIKELPRTAADAIVLRKKKTGYEILLITRLKATF